ncbi:MAG: glycosyltransferase [Tsuneonella sp.]
MKTLIILPSATVGGAERIAFGLAEYLLTRGNQVIVFAMTRGPGKFWPALSRYPGFTLHAPPARSAKTALLRLPCDLLRLRKYGPFDLLYSSHVRTNALAAMLVALGVVRSRFVVARESTRIFERFKGLKLLTYRLCYALYGRIDLLILQTEDMKRSLLAHVRLARRTCAVVIPNPVDLEAIERQCLDARRTRVTAPASENFEIVFCGRLIPVKRVSLLLRAMAHIHAQWHLTILGDGPLREQLEDESRRLGVSNRVTFHGSVDNPFAHFAGADLGVLVSEVEGFPNVLLEMMASGTKTLVATPCTAAIAELPGVTILTEPTSEALAETISQAIEQRRDLSALYRRYIEDRRTIHSFAGALFGHLHGKQGPDHRLQ